MTEKALKTLRSASAMLIFLIALLIGWLVAVPAEAAEGDVAKEPVYAGITDFHASVPGDKDRARGGSSDADPLGRGGRSGRVDKR